MKKVVVLGGAGAMGQVIVRDLVEFADGCETVIADFNKEKAETLARSMGKSSCTSVFADLNDSAGMIQVLSGASVVINSTQYYYNVRVMEAALQAGCHYMDLGGLFHVTREQQTLHQRFADRKLLAILGMGAAPGMTNIMAAAGASRLDTVDSIDIAIGCVDFVQVDHPLAPPYALDTILDEYTKEPMVFEHGNFKAVAPMSGEIVVDFPAPVGRSSAILTLHSEVATLPQSYQDKGVKQVTFRLGLPPEFHHKLKLLIDIGFGGSDKLKVDSAEVVPRKVLAKLLERFPAPQQDPDDCEVVRVDVQGRRQGAQTLVRTETIVRPHPQWKVSCGALDTGVPPSIAAQMILKGEISKIGVLAPEVCVPFDRFFEELSKRGIDIEIKSVVPAETSLAQ